MRSLLFSLLDNALLPACNRGPKLSRRIAEALANTVVACPLLATKGTKTIRISWHNPAPWPVLPAGSLIRRRPGRPWAKTSGEATNLAADCLLEDTIVRYPA